MTDYGGIVPEIASREHLKGLPLAVSEALAQSGIHLDEIDWFTVTNRPGLVGALLVGVSYVKALAFARGKPFTALDHIASHIYSPLIASAEGAAPPPPFPWVALVVSGGHTDLFEVRGPGDHRWLGGTLDDAAGEAFDKVGKLLSLPYPAGPTIDRAVREKATDADRTRFSFPRAQVPALSFSYSGLKTAVGLKVAELGEMDAATRLAVAASAQEAILEPLVKEARRASLQYGGRIVVTGGVACNSRLRELLPEAYFPERRHCTDNAAMVAMLSHVLHEQGRLTPSPWSTGAIPNGAMATPGCV